MKLYAQHGYGPGDKIVSGVAEHVVDGVVFGAKDVDPNQIPSDIRELKATGSRVDILFDPQYYASILPRTNSYRTGKLDRYPYWGAATRNDTYFLSQANVERDIRDCLEFQSGLSLTASIAPNIIVRHSLNSRDGASASQFINLTGAIARQVNPDRRILATLALSREALLDTTELERFVHLITSLQNPPDGFYLLLALAGPLPSEVFHPTVVENMLFLVSSLKLNGFDVVIGYCDLLGPVLASVGADAGCSGWFGTMRTFSLNRFEPAAGGGRQPRPMYLSMAVFNRIFVSELFAAYRLNANVRNGLPLDAPYFDGTQVTEPNTKTEECLQSWEALQRLQQFVSSAPASARIDRLRTVIQDAAAFYESLRRDGMTFESKSGDACLKPLLQGLAAYERTI